MLGGSISKRYFKVILFKRQMKRAYMRHLFQLVATFELQSILLGLLTPRQKDSFGKTNPYAIVSGSCKYLFVSIPFIILIVYTDSIYQSVEVGSILGANAALPAPNCWSSTIFTRVL